MSFNHQDLVPLILTKRPKPTEKQKVAKPQNNSPSNGIKVEKIWDPKDPDSEPETRPVMITHELGQQIQQARTARGMTQKELAKVLCIPSSVINDYERGEGVHNFIHISKIKNYLGITKNKV